MTAKEELSQYKYARERVDEALEEYQKYKTRATKMTAILSDNPQRSNLNSDKVGDNAAAMADIANEYEKRWFNAERERLRIENNIDRVEEPYRTILHMRYVEDMQLFEIATKLKYESYTYVCEQHGKALKKYEENRIKPKTTEV